MYSAARAELEARSSGAADVGLRIMNDPNAKAADRLRMAASILGQRPAGLPLDDIPLDDFYEDSTDRGSALVPDQGSALRCLKRSEPLLPISHPRMALELT